MAKDAKMSRYCKATSGDDDNGVESLVSRLTHDLRVSVHKLDAYEVLSPKWLEMSDIFGRIATISDMESKLADPKDQSGTLWETEEQALRIILEDGKLGICLRCLVDYKRYQRSNKSMLSDIKSPISAHLAACNKFEKGLGTVLLNAWNHTEALQMMDMPAMVNHIADVLENSLEDGGALLDTLAHTGEIHLMQEGIVLAYIGSIAKQFEHISEDRVMPIMRSRGVFMRAMNCLKRIHKSLPEPFLLRCIESLSLFVETEDFKTYRLQHMQASDLDDLLSFKSACLIPLQTETANRLILRPLIDCIDKSKRLLSAGSKK